MILDDLKRMLPEYKIRRITEKNFTDLFELQKTNPYFFDCELGHPVTYQEAIDGVTALPPHTDYTFAILHTRGAFPVVRPERLPVSIFVWLAR